MLRDLRLAWRLFVKNPAFTAVVVVTLALGIGLNTAVFSAVDALLLRPLPGVRAPNEVVQLYRAWPSMPYGSNSVQHYLSIREKTTAVFSDVALWDFETFSISTSSRPRRAFGQMVSANFFSMLGVRPLKGRLFLPEEDIGRGAHPVVVLSEPTWKSMFGGDPEIVGKKVVLNGRAYTIVGIAPGEFRGIIPIVQPALWIPLMQFNDARPGYEKGFENRDNNSFNVIARLKPGVTPAMARVRMTALVTELRGVYPDAYKKNGITLVPQSQAGVHPMFRNTEVGLSALVMSVVAILLLIACVNVANLFLARARDRAREMAIRLSLGARRSVLLRQLLIESTFFAGIAGIVSLGVAWWAIGLANQIQLPFDVGFSADLRLSPMVLLFTFGASVFTGLLFSIAPALQATRPSLVPALKGEAPAGRSRARASSGLVVAQMALSIVLLVCAGLFLRNLRAATTVDKGFSASFNWRYVGSMTNADNSGDPAIGGTPERERTSYYRVAPQSYFDLALNFAIAKQFSLRLIANNLFDKTPPIVPDSYDVALARSNTIPQRYDSLGRNLAIGTTIKF